MSTAPEALARLAALASERADRVRGEPRIHHASEAMIIVSNRYPTDQLPQVYDPVICLVLHGAKDVTTPDRTHAISAGEFLVVAHDMPVVSRITSASPSEPYLAAILSLDYAILADLEPAVRSLALPDDGDPHALSMERADAELIDAFARYLRALDTPHDASVLAPMVIREIHYRVLTAPRGHAVRRLSTGQRQAETVSRAIAMIRRELARAWTIAELADGVGLSASALHEHFKAVTGTTPLQFQKQLRLLQAQRLIQSDSQSVTDAAYTVGYSTPTQFSREYRRAFGHPPSHDRPRAGVSA